MSKLALTEENSRLQLIIKRLESAIREKDSQLEKRSSQAPGVEVVKKIESLQTVVTDLQNKLDVYESLTAMSVDACEIIRGEESDELKAKVIFSESPEQTLEFELSLLDEDIVCKPGVHSIDRKRIPGFLSGEIKFTTAAAPLFVKNVLAVVHSKTVDRE
jgi:hypothetical protein